MLCLFVAFLIVGTVAVVGIFGPGAAGAVTKALIEDAGSQSIKGSVRVDGVEFGWGGPQFVRGIEVVSAGGEVLARVDSISLDRSLLSLASTPLDVGEALISGGYVVLEESPDGTYTLNEALEPSVSVVVVNGEESGGDQVEEEVSEAERRQQPLAMLPSGLRAGLRIENFSVTHRSAERELKARVNSLSTGVIETGGDITMGLKATTLGPNDAQTGSVEAEILVRSLIDASGAVVVERAVVEKVRTLATLPDTWVSVLDAAAFGDVSAGDDGSNVGLSINIDIVRNGDQLVLAGESGEVELVRGMVTPGLAGLLAGGSPVELRGRPGFVVMGKELSWPARVLMPGASNAGGIGVEVVVDSFEAELLESAGIADAGDVVRVEPETLRTAAALRDGGKVTINGGSNVFVNGELLAAFVIDADTSGFVSDAGAIDGVPWVTLGSDNRASGVTLLQIDPSWSQIAKALFEGDPAGAFGTTSDEVGSVLLGVGGKSTLDDPLRVRVPAGSRLRVPIDAELEMLEGEVELDFGGLSFEAGSLGGVLLESVRGNTEGAGIRPLEPVLVTAKAGVVTVPETELRIGDVTMSASAVIWLAESRFERMVRVSPTRLGGDVGKAIEAVPGLERVATVPLRQSGTFGNPGDWELAVDLISEDILDPQNLLDAAREIIDDENANDVLDRLNDLFGGGN